jgi:hypothetical protein
MNLEKLQEKLVELGFEFLSVSENEVQFQGDHYYVASVEDVETAESYVELEDVAEWVSCCGETLDHDVPMCPRCKEWC